MRRGNFNFPVAFDGAAAAELLARTARRDSATKHRRTARIPPPCAARLLAGGIREGALLLEECHQRRALGHEHEDFHAGGANACSGSDGKSRRYSRTWRTTVGVTVPFRNASWRYARAIR